MEFGNIGKSQGLECTQERHVGLSMGALPNRSMSRLQLAHRSRSQTNYIERAACRGFGSISLDAEMQLPCAHEVIVLNAAMMPNYSWT